MVQWLILLLLQHLLQILLLSNSMLHLPELPSANFSVIQEDQRLSFMMIYQSRLSLTGSVFIITPSTRP